MSPAWLGPPWAALHALLSGLLLLTALLRTSSTATSTPPCSSTIGEALRGSFGSREIGTRGGDGSCTWIVHNPDPTKYSVFLKIAASDEESCRDYRVAVRSFDLHLPAGNGTSSAWTAPGTGGDVLQPCSPATNALSPLLLLRSNADDVEVQISRISGREDQRLGPAGGDSELSVDFLLLDNVLGSVTSAGGCGVLCSWLESGNFGCVVLGPRLQCAHGGELSVALPCACSTLPVTLPASPLASRTDDCPRPGCLPKDVAHDRGKGVQDWLPLPLTAARSQGLRSLEVQGKRLQTRRPFSSQQYGGEQDQSPGGGGKEWSEWSQCSTTCGEGSQVRTWACVPNLCNGTLREQRICNNSAVCPVHGTWEEWTPWSLCSLTCGRGLRTRERTCNEPQYGGNHCDGPKNQSKVCSIALCPVDGKWTKWSNWTPCSVSCANGTQQRSRECEGPIYGGAECRGQWTEKQECYIRVCPVDGQWMSWGQWNECPVTCGRGERRRIRVCHGPFNDGKMCDGLSSETKTCAEAKCPAPHEICRQEQLGSVTWQKTAATNVATNRCPTDATGVVIRQCSLNSDGVASWEKLSFIKCISHDVRNALQLMRDQLAVGQATPEGMAAVLGNLAGTSQTRLLYSGDLLACIEVLRNFTQEARRVSRDPTSEDIQNFLEIVSNLLSDENRPKWEDMPTNPPAVLELMQLVEDFVHVVGSGIKLFSDMYIAKDNIVVGVHKLSSAEGGTDLTFPVKGRRNMIKWVKSSEDKVVISNAALSSGRQGEPPPVYVIGVSFYKNLEGIIPKPSNGTIINSRIVSVTIRPAPKNKDLPLLEIEFSHTSNGTGAFCSSWDAASRDATLGKWSPRFCKTLLSDAGKTLCQCGKVSAFTILAQQAQTQKVEPVRTLSVALIVGCSISSLALMLLIFIYTLIWRSIKSDRSVILINFCLSIISSNILILVGQTQTQNKGVCTMIAVFLHFSFLATFCWVLTEAWQSYMAVRGVTMKRIIRKRFLCMGWGLPALVVATSVGFTKASGYGTANYCWLSLEGGLLYSFVGPAAAVVLVNMVLGILVFNKLVSKEGIPDKELKHRAGSSLWSSCVVLPLLALTWMSAVLAITDPRSSLFQILFSVFDSLQGCVIFSVHCILKKEVQSAIKFRITGRLEPSEPCSYFQNGHAQIMTDFEKDVDLACRSVLHQKDIKPSRSSTVASTLSRTSAPDNDANNEQTEMQPCLGQTRLPGSSANEIPMHPVTQIHMSTMSTLPRFQESSSVVRFQDSAATLPRFQDSAGQMLHVHEHVNSRGVPDHGPHGQRFQESSATMPRFQTSGAAMSSSRYQDGGARVVGFQDPISQISGQQVVGGYGGFGERVRLGQESGSGGGNGHRANFGLPFGGGGGGGGGGGDRFSRTDSDLLRAQERALEKDYIVLQSSLKEGKGGTLDGRQSDGGGGLGYGARGGGGGGGGASTGPRMGLQSRRTMIKPGQRGNNASNTLTSLPEFDKGVIRQLLNSESGSTTSVNSLDRRKAKYSELDFQKIMHTRKRHHEMFHEMSQKFPTLDRHWQSPADSLKQSEKRWSLSSPGSDSVVESVSEMSSQSRPPLDLPTTDSSRRQSPAPAMWPFHGTGHEHQMKDASEQEASEDLISFTGGTGDFQTEV
ncbi:LOW QUALITY PROTEIN: adhesion G protein-coupled receptor B3-like [Lethenteron reissneri]|uniref:LOW QUALITY PROTEIN: adhesion G protein-coupled receptor B3-like n=1 Tax=Lethenteron reissneri TaxID=7753 RepID=UPI002AB6D6BE|nr:LOW QUALITY PROTEIN: adhesion G protein-coupled receptor B3-like [Lethenteron reissneri]